MTMANGTSNGSIELKSRHVADLNLNSSAQYNETDTNGSNGQVIDSTIPDTDTATATATATAQELASQIQAKYAAERLKRLRPDFDDQWVKLQTSDKFKHFTHDPWLPVDGSTGGISLAEDGDYHFKFVIQGAGFGGLLYAARLVQAGFSSADIVLIDYAGGFGGTWYWNRYPGLMCDVSSDVYIPLLEETGYVPKHKYSHGQELRAHAERIAKHYGLEDQAIFRATVSEATWNEAMGVWQVKVCQEQGARQGVDAVKITTILEGQYFIPLTGVLNYPKLPRIPGVESFEGHQFHTSRWDYEYTGGSQEHPDMTKLKDKRVGLVGTGPTNMQSFPELAKWAKSVHIFQRTPASVDERNQKEIDVEVWNRECKEPGWQRKRQDNFAAFVSQANEKEEPNLIDDAWTRMPSFKALVGGPNTINPTDPSTIYAYIAQLHTMDLPRQERIRKRVDSIVQDKDTAERLKSWYPTWCKRPCFHDEYLQTLNKPNACLVDTEGKGIDKMNGKNVIVGNNAYEIDVLIWGTGFVNTSDTSPAGRSNITIRGRNGRSIAQKWDEAVATLHGVVTRDFPNLFFTLQQSGASANNIHIFEATCEHAVYMIKTAEEQQKGRKILIEPTHQAEEAWSMRIAGNAAAFAGLSGCTPNYYTGEGRADAEAATATMEQQFKKARGAPWGQGILDYQRITRAWRDEGKLEGLDITVLN